METSTEREPRIERVAPDSANPVVRQSFDAFIKARGKVPNLFRIAAQRPAIEATLAAHLDAVMGPGEVEQQLKELLAVRVSHINRTQYCLASHSLLAKRHGASSAQVDALAIGELSGFDDAWRAALEVADEMTSGGGQVSDARYARLAAAWRPEQIVEIVAVVGLFNYFNRFANALEIPITR